MYISPYTSSLHSDEVEAIEKETFELDEGETFGDPDKKTRGWVLMHDDKVVGFCTYETWNPTLWHFLDLVVKPEYTKKGYGSDLVKHLVEAADREGATLITRAYKGHPHLIKFYKNYGFELESENKSKLGSVSMIRKQKN